MHMVNNVISIYILSKKSVPSLPCVHATKTVSLAERQTAAKAEQCVPLLSLCCSVFQQLAASTKYLLSKAWCNSPPPSHIITRTSCSLFAFFIIFALH